MELKNARALIVLPDKDFDPTETSVPWDALVAAGLSVHFCTESGSPAECDSLLITGVIFGQLGATPEVVQLYSAMTQCAEYRSPLRYEDVDFMGYEVVLLPGGHAPGMKQYLENRVIREKIRPFFQAKDKVVGAICHGTIVLARTIDPETGKSILHERTTTTLPKYMERNAYYLTAWKLGKYYRTYEEYVEDEVRGVLKFPSRQLNLGPTNVFGSLNECYAHVGVDGNYVSARWPGDAKLFAKTILQKLKGIK